MQDAASALTQAFLGRIKLGDDFGALHESFPAQAILTQIVCWECFKHVFTRRDSLKNSGRTLTSMFGLGEIAPYTRLDIHVILRKHFQLNPEAETRQEDIYQILQSFNSSLKIASFFTFCGWGRL